MLDIFRGLKNLVKVNHIQIDSSIFRLHYSITVMMLIAFSLIVTTRQYVGNPIDCIHTKDIPEDVLNTFCWIHSTYTIKTAFSKQVGKEVPYPGVDSSRGNIQDQKCYRYYQWVCFCLFFQAILFYTPRWLWKNWEGGKINSLMMDLDIGICSKEEKNLKSKLLSDYLYDNLKLHNWWAYKYFFCEFLALGNVVGQMFLMNRFFDGEFFNFGINVIRFMEADEEDRTDPMIYIFPRMTKCTFYKFGVSGEIERHDAVCILPLNVVNEKIYVFLWFWFLILGLLTLGVILYRVVIIMSPRMRVYLLRLRFRLIRRDAISVLVKESKMGDWFLIYMLGVNVDSIIFRDVMHDLAKRLQHHHLLPDPMKAI
ncbi:Innexin inx2, putative [Pediculus humanus corporis]|uniref:Innexin n=1 Tax=Pediculus humanus subsp. corporis TaxID=121224 RepID=E0VDS4_PEDHC|nr:Innexin inx2, putative [Pediculus humanus corporis]EEB11530.1 Innexin inx2, putative [Pediculus humanus corporis]